MPSDASIYNLVRQPQAPPNPLEQYGQTMQLKNLIGQGKIQDRAIAEDEATRAAYAESGGDPVKLKELLYGKGLYKPAQAVEKFMFEKKKAEGDIKKTDLESNLLQIKQVREIAAQVRSDADLPAAQEQVSSLIGHDKMAKIPFFNQPYSQEEQNRVITSVDEKLKQMAAGKVQDVTKRGQDISAATTRRGQDKPIWDSTRRAFIPQPGVSAPGTAPVGQNAPPVTPGAIRVPNLPKTDAEIKASKQEELQLATVDRTTTGILDTINRLVGTKGKPGEKGLPEHPGLEGSVGYFDANVFVPPSTRAQADAQTLIKNLLDKSAVEGLSTLRGSGTAPGSITEKEWPIMQNYLAAIDPHASAPLFREQVKAYRDSVIAYRNKVKEAIANNPTPDNSTLPARTAPEPVRTNVAPGKIKFLGFE